MTVAIPGAGTIALCATAMRSDAGLPPDAPIRRWLPTALQDIINNHTVLVASATATRDIQMWQTWGLYPHLFVDTSVTMGQLILRGDVPVQPGGRVGLAAQERLLYGTSDLEQGDGHQCPATSHPSRRERARLAKTAHTPLGMLSLASLRSALDDEQVRAVWIRDLPTHRAIRVALDPFQTRLSSTAALWLTQGTKTCTHSTHPGQARPGVHGRATRTESVAGQDIGTTPEVRNVERKDVSRQRTDQGSAKGAPSQRYRGWQG